MKRFMITKNSVLETHKAQPVKSKPYIEFNVNLLNYNEHNWTNKFVDSLVSNSFIPLVL